MKKLLAKVMLKVLPEAPEIEDLKKKPGETQAEYQSRVPLQQQPIAEQPTLNYLGKPLR